MSISRADWLDFIATCAATGRNGFTAGDLVVAHAFTRGSFNYTTGAQRQHLTLGVIAERAGVSEATVTRFLRRAKRVGALREQQGKRRAFHAGQRRTPLYRLAVPKWAIKAPTAIASVPTQPTPEDPPILPPIPATPWSEAPWAGFTDDEPPPW